MPIKRIWHGWTSQGNADTYETLLRDVVFAEIEAKKITGYRGIELLRCDHGNGTETEVEFITIMTFDSLQSVIDFQGPDYQTAYVPDSAQQLLKRWDKTSGHFEVREKRQYG